MKKRFRLILDFKAEIKEKIKTKGQNKGKRKKLNLLLREFLKDDQAILDLYKLWLLGDLQSDEHLEAIEKDIKIRDEKEIIKSVLKKLSRKTEQYFIEILECKDNAWFDELEIFFKQFTLFKLEKARFKEVDD